MNCDVTVHYVDGRVRHDTHPTLLHAQAQARGFLRVAEVQLVIVRANGTETERWVRASSYEWTHQQTAEVPAP